MRLSEAIKHGSTLRPESHQERFIEVENRGLCSDAWGAAVEAVWPMVARLNWNAFDTSKFENAMERFRAAQEHYFGRYRTFPVRCPGASRTVLRAAGRVINRKGDVKVYADHQRLERIAGLTDECGKVTHLYGMVDHLYYAHNNSREQIAEMFGWYEETRDTAEIVRAFTHYQNPVLSGAIKRRLFLQAKHTAEMKAEKARLGRR
jgi:hypothetical protein